MSITFLIFDRGTLEPIGHTVANPPRLEPSQIIGGIATRIDQNKLLQGGISSPLASEPLTRPGTARVPAKAEDFQKEILTNYGNP